MPALTLRPSSSLTQTILATYSKAMNQAKVRSDVDPKRILQLRCSALPYCARSRLFSWASEGRVFDMDMSMNFYVNVGTSVHTTMQTYLPLVGKFVADYHCRSCGTWHRLSTKSKCCGKPCDYHELTIAYKGIHGHVDAVIKIGDEYYVIDFKTTSLAQAARKARTPPESYMWQIRSYAYLLRKQYELNIKGVALVFIPRDNPRKPTVWEEATTPKSLERTKEKLKHWRQVHKKTMVAASKSEFRELLEERCGDQYCKGCKISTPNLLRLLVEQKAEFPIKERLEIP